MSLCRQLLLLFLYCALPLADNLTSRTVTTPAMSRLTFTHPLVSLTRARILARTVTRHRRAERTVRIGKDGDGECISAKSACALSGMGGSHASFDPVRPEFVFASESADPLWVLNTPTAVVNGVRMQALYMCNEKGSFTAELFRDYLRYIASIKPAGEWAVIFCDCIATHLSVENLKCMHVNKIKLTPRQVVWGNDTPAPNGIPARGHCAAWLYDCEVSCYACRTGKLVTKFARATHKGIARNEATEITISQCGLLAGGTASCYCTFDTSCVWVHDRWH